MNHSGDTNKMVGETPRTDAHIDGLRRDPEVSGCDRTLDFARQLERELNAANQRIKRLEGELESTKADRDSWSNQSDEFAKTAADLIIRIKQLEEAGDKMERWCSDAVSADNWRKAKEAQP